MEVIITLVNSIPDHIRFLLMDNYPNLYELLSYIFTVWEDGSIGPKP